MSSRPRVRSEKAISVVAHRLFNPIVLGAIFLNSLVLAMTDYDTIDLDPDSISYGTPVILATMIPELPVYI